MLSMNGLNLCQADPARLPLGAYPAAKKDLAGINIADTCHKGMVEQDIFDGTDCFLKSFAA